MKLSHSTFAPVLFALCSASLCSCGDSDSPEQPHPTTTAKPTAQQPQSEPATTPMPEPEQPSAPSAHPHSGGVLPDMQDDDYAEPVDDEDSTTPAPTPPSAYPGIVFEDDDSAELVEEPTPEPAPANKDEVLIITELHTDHSFTPGAIIICAEKGNMEEVETLLKNGADINAQDEIGYTPLMAACVAGKTDMVRYLIQTGAEVNKTNSLKETALMLAAQNGHAEAVKLLLAAGADKTMKDALQQTAQQHAWYKKHQEIMELLSDNPN
ncbi:MAG: ankyrin repeat domain-containing protein [Akkermansia sp.]|nr:ankyrin repeat domain-containing protein [Akkermansia sp.]